MAVGGTEGGVPIPAHRFSLPPCSNPQYKVPGLDREGAQAPPGNGSLQGPGTLTLFRRGMDSGHIPFHLGPWGGGGLAEGRSQSQLCHISIQMIAGRYMCLSGFPSELFLPFWLSLPPYYLESYADRWSPSSICVPTPRRTEAIPQCRLEEGT